MLNMLKTVVLLAALSALTLAVGRLFGTVGFIIAILIAVGFNLGTYYYADRLVLRMYNAQPTRDPRLLREVEALARSAAIPTPKTYIIASAHPNAFATGRSPKHGSIALTQGLLERLNPRELRGVIAHELAHIKHRDILIATIAAMLAAIITNIANMAQWAAIFGLGTSEEGPGLLEMLALIIVTPIAAMLIQLAISRSREYAADARAAKLTRDPHALIGALRRIHQSRPMEAANPATASLFIANPLRRSALAGLLSTHPTLERRVARLEKARV